MEHVTHVFDPVYDKKSRILVLGTFPSVKSREMSFYYGHPQNRFWKVLAALTGRSLPETIEEKKRLLLENGIAIWDVIASCDIQGSSDSSIKNVVPNDIDRIVKIVPDITIFGNGEKAFSLYQKYCREQTGKDMIKLPSTSPANAAFSLDKLTMVWREAFDRAGWCTMI
ncbi:MAG: DNA-deoxyinosine glycosylase [Clostridiales bacterium]|nr:DNA-deoxyinosine glycosylase [Clostridiales bacterium]